IRDFHVTGVQTCALPIYNVIYNWVHRGIDGGDYQATYNIFNSYFKPGPATPKGQPIRYRILKPESGRSKLPYVVFGRAYVAGNRSEERRVGKSARSRWPR